MPRSGKPDGSCTSSKSLRAPTRTMTNDTTGAYLNAIGKYPLLTKSQEILLGSQVQAWVAIKSKNPNTYSEEEKRIEKIGKKARDKFIKCNLRLVVNIAKKYARYCKSLDLMDLVQEGNIGLARAVEKFDPTRGYAMSTYAYWWIRQSMQRAIQFSDLTIRLSINIHDATAKIRRTTEELSKKMGKHPSLEEVSSACGISVEEIKSIIAVPKIAFSLDKQVADKDGDSYIIDIIPDMSNLNTVEDIEQRINTENLFTAINAYLDDRTKLVVLSRNQDPPTSWKKLSKDTGISIEKLQAIEKEGIKKCSLLLDIKNKLNL
jgi:RNA polymerase primary sigma factor